MVHVSKEDCGEILIDDCEQLLEIVDAIENVADAEETAAEQQEIEDIISCRDG